MNGLDLFSGIGGLSLALSPWVRPIVYCENDRYAQAVLLSRIADRSLPLAPIWDDVRTLGSDHMPGPVDIIYGGFPCQDISVAGRGKGLEGERSGLFLHVARLAEEVRPAFIFLENVPAIRTRGLSVVCDELARLGFDIRWTTVSAAEVGAPHLRKRWFLLAAHPERIKLWIKSGRGCGKDRQRTSLAPNAGEKGTSANTDCVGELQQVGRIRELGRWTCDASWWSSEPDVERVVYGVPFGDDRTRGLGNAVVPLQARVAFQRLAGLESRGVA